MPPYGNDLTLFKKVSSGDRIAFNILFQKYYAGLCRFAHSYLNSKEDSDEIVSDLFFNLWKNRQELAIESNFKAYIYVSVRRACLHHLNKTKIFFDDVADCEGFAETTDHWTPHSAMQFAEISEEIKVAVDRLPAACRRIFVMSRSEQLSYSEIASILSISTKTVENQLVKALSLLRIYLAHLASTPRLNSKVTN